MKNESERVSKTLRLCDFAGDIPNPDAIFSRKDAKDAEITEK